MHRVLLRQLCVYIQGRLECTYGQQVLLLVGGSTYCTAELNSTGTYVHVAHNAEQRGEGVSNLCVPASIIMAQDMCKHTAAPSMSY
jgi:hypothetical protein